jgi:predicted transcriptional regulator
MDTDSSVTPQDVEQLREKRESAGLTQVDLARRAGYSVSYIRLLEAGLAPRWSRVVPDVLRVLDGG